MKECYWCNKSCPDSEEGSFEVDPKDESIEIGWICDHCVLTFNGKCDCAECVTNDKVGKKALAEYDRTHMTPLARLFSWVLG